MPRGIAGFDVRFGSLRNIGNEDPLAAERIHRLRRVGGIDRRADVRAIPSDGLVRELHATSRLGSGDEAASPSLWVTLSTSSSVLRPSTAMRMPSSRRGMPPLALNLSRSS